MNRTFYYLTSLVVASLFMVSCNDSKAPIRRGISFKSNIQSEINSSPLRAYDNQWEANDGIGVFMLRSGESLSNAGARLYSNRQYTTTTGGTNGIFTAANGQTMFFPEDNSQAVDFIAYYPYNATLNNAQNIAINVATQPAIDLLWSNNLTGMKAGATQSELTLQFAHMLSTVRINIKDAAGVPITNASIKIEGLSTTASFDLSDASISNIADVNAITLPTGKSDAIIIPETPTQAVILAVISGKTYKYEIPNNTTFQRGKRTTFNLKIAQEGTLEIEGIGAVITDWDEAAPIDGTLVPEEQHTAEYEGGVEWLFEQLEEAGYGAQATITEEKSISVVVTSNRNNINSLRNLFVSNDKQGMTIRLAENNPGYDQGDELVLNLKDSKISRYMDGGMTLEIDNAQVKKLDTPAHAITPEVIAFNELFAMDPNTYQVMDYDKWHGRLVTITGVQFVNGAKGYALYDSSNESVTFNDLQDTNATIEPPVMGYKLPSVAISKYCPFGKTKMPSGNGSVTGVLSYNRIGAMQFTTAAIWIRSVDDLNMEAPRK